MPKYNNLNVETMGSDKDKQEKKRLKSQIKLEKKQMKREREATAEEIKPVEPVAKDGAHVKPGAGRKVSRNLIDKEKEQLPWYKSPEWLRAIAAIASLIVAVITLTILIYRG